MSAAGPPQGARPPGGAARSAVRGEHTSYARAYALLVAATLAAYATSLGGVFQFDDHRVIVDNPAVHDFSAWWASMPGIRPLLKASYALSWRMGGGDALAFHVFNLACHVASACLVLALARRWLDGTLLMPAAGPPRFVVAPMLPLAVALLFALHPAQTEAVTYVSGRSSGFMAMLYLASLLCWEISRGRHMAAGDLPGRESGVRSRGFLAASLALFAAALAVKESAWTLPFAIFLVEVTRNGARWRAALRAAGPHLALLAAGALAILALPGYRRMLEAAFTLRDPLANLAAQVSGVTYLVLHPLLLLDLDIDPKVTVLGGLAWWIAAAVLLALLGLGIRGAWRGLVPGFGIAWFFLHLAPTNSLIARDDLANDRQLVLALIGLALAFCSFAWVRLPRRAFAPVIAALAIVLGSATAVRNLDYRSEVALWQSSLASNPRNARAWNNLGMAWRAAGEVPQARAAFQRALELDPAHPQAVGNLLELDRPR